MENAEKNIVIIAGEASGDNHGAYLVHALKDKNPSLTFSGLGGPQMAKAGVELYHDMTKLALVGFAEVLKHYPQIRKIFYNTLDEIRRRKPAAVILIDYPGFNMRLARKLRAQGIKVIYYISPQVWAWKEERVRELKANVNLMLVIFQFEKEFYAKHGMDVEFVGHPLMDEINVSRSKLEFLSDKNLQDFKMTIGLLPGSRPKEVDRHLPVMLKAAALLHDEFPMLQFLVFKADAIDESAMESSLLPCQFPVRITSGEYYDALNACDVCVVASGTATLETALMEKPMVIIYKTSWATWFLAKLFIKIPCIGLVNVVAQKAIVPERVQIDASPEKIASAAKLIFTNELMISEMKDEFRKVKRSLGGPGASRRAAEKICAFLNF